MRGKRGVTLGSLIITILVMLIIFGVTVTSGTSLLKSTEKNKIMTNLYMVKARAETLLEDYLFDGTDNLGDEAESAKVSYVGWNYNDGYEYRVWTASKLKAEGLDTSNMSSSEYFVVQYDIQNDSVDVASSRGFKGDDSNKYYTLSELKELE